MVEDVRPLRSGKRGRDRYSYLARYIVGTDVERRKSVAQAQKMLDALQHDEDVDFSDEVTERSLYVYSGHAPLSKDEQIKVIVESIGSQQAWIDIVAYAFEQSVIDLVGERRAEMRKALYISAIEMDAPAHDQPIPEWCKVGEWERRRSCVYKVVLNLMGLYVWHRDLPPYDGRINRHDLPGRIVHTNAHSKIKRRPDNRNKTKEKSHA